MWVSTFSMETSGSAAPGLRRRSSRAGLPDTHGRRPASSVHMRGGVRSVRPTGCAATRKSPVGRSTRFLGPPPRLASVAPQGCPSEPRPHYFDERPQPVPEYRDRLNVATTPGLPASRPPGDELRRGQLGAAMGRRYFTRRHHDRGRARSRSPGLTGPVGLRAPDGFVGAGTRGGPSSGRIGRGGPGREPARARTAQ